MHRLLLSGAVALGLFLALAQPAAEADPSKTQVGAQRAVFAKSGTRLSEKASMLSKAVKTLPYGTRVRVDAVQGGYLQVTEFVNGQAGATGWVKASQTVEPFALTGGGQTARRTTSRGTGRITQREIAAAGRQFDESVEGKHKQASSAAIRAAYARLDNLVEAIKPTLVELRAFVKEGRLGRAGGRKVRGGS